MLRRNCSAFSILVTGVGGQGVLLISKVIAAAAVENNYFACRTESRGLSQRGGSVCSEVRFGWKELIPVIGSGEDLIIALDGLEGMRVLTLLKPDGILLANSNVAVPTHLSRQTDFNDAEKCNFEQRIILALTAEVRTVAVDFQSAVTEPSYLNAVLLGAASLYIPLPASSLCNALIESVKETTIHENVAAFHKGQCAMQGYLDKCRTITISA